MSFAPTPVQRPREQVLAQLRSAILGGSFKEGSRLPAETELARQFNVSRTTLREALRSLATDGLVEKIPGARGGTFVRAIDPEAFSDRIRDSIDAVIRFGTISVPELIEVRQFLELPACEVAAVKRTDAQLAELRKCLDAAEGLPYENPESEHLHIRFHTLIGEIAGNRLMSAFISALHRIPFDTSPETVPDDYVQRTHDQHEAVLHALEESDPTAVRTRMEEHLAYLREINPTLD